MPVFRFGPCGALGAALRPRRVSALVAELVRVRAKADARRSRPKSHDFGYSFVTETGSIYADVFLRHDKLGDGPSLHHSEHRFAPFINRAGT